MLVIEPKAGIADAHDAPLITIVYTGDGAGAAAAADVACELHTFQLTIATHNSERRDMESKGVCKSLLGT